MRALAIALLALALAAPAGASNIATPRMVEVASWAAGKPVEVYCSSDDDDWRRVTAAAGNPSGERAGGFTIFTEPVVYIGPDACHELSSMDFPQRFAAGLSILLHESAHQRGFRDEAVAECAARVLVYSVLNRFYGVPWFSSRMRTVVDAFLAFSLRKAASYQGGCERL